MSPYSSRRYQGDGLLRSRRAPHKHRERKRTAQAHRAPSNSRRFRRCVGALLAVAAALSFLTACSPPKPTPVWTPTAVLFTPSPTEAPTATATPLREDSYEPNDSLPEATGPLVPGEDYHGFIGSKEDIDFFYLEIDTPQIVELYLTSIPPQTDYDLYLITGDEDVLADSSNTGEQDEHIEYATSSVGVFYVVVVPFDNYSQTEPYSLRLGLSPAPTPSGQDNYEPNDTFSEATGPLNLGASYQSYIWDEGDKDVYFFQVSQSQNLKISLTEITSVADYDLFLYNAAEELLASSELMVDRETIQQNLPPGTYYVIVLSASGFSRNDPYSLSIDSAGP
jgi:hypothetical protein